MSWALLKNNLVFIPSLWLGIVLFSGCWAWFFTQKTITFLRENNTIEAEYAAKSGSVGTGLLRGVTLGLVPDITAWDAGLRIIANLEETQIAASFVVQPLSGGPVEALQTELSGEEAEQVIDSQLLLLQRAIQSYKKSWFIRKQLQLPSWIPSDDDTLDTLALIVGDMVAPRWSAGRHTYIILFQNTHELRPTGGFPGSFAKLTIQNGQVTEFVIDDIYQPDGQFTGFRQAPPGVNEYLSSGKGWRLPDANWSPDFPTSAQDIMSYFALGEVQDITGVAAVNLTLVERLLEITGPLQVPDLNLTVTADNFAEVARLQREQFFPGSQQKANLLRALTTQFKQKLHNLNRDQWLNISQALITHMSKKNIQVFSLDPDVQRLSEHLDLEGSVWVPSQSDGLMAIEANVGINKVNPFISRSTKLTLNDYSAELETTWINTAPPTEVATMSGYVNYHRVWAPSDWVLKTTSITTSAPPGTQSTGSLISQPITITHDTEQQFWNESGLLVLVPQGTTTTLSMEFSKPSFNESPPYLTLFNQSGLPPSPFTLVLPNKTTSWVQDGDVTVPLLQ